MDDVEDPRLADYSHLTDAAARRAIEGGEGEGIFIAEGVLALRQLLRSHHRIRSVLSTPARADAVRAELDGVPAQRVAGVPHLVADRGALRAITGFDVHRGVLAAADRGRPQLAAELLPRCERIAVAVGINDHENLGSLFRNAAALGLDAVLLDDTAADPLYRRSIRVSSGWSMRLHWARIGAAPDLAPLLRGHGFTTVALTPDPTATAVDGAAAAGLMDGRVALVVGAEGPGLPNGVIRDCDTAVRVPMAGEVDSLNVATSLAVVAAFAAARRGW